MGTLSPQTWLSPWLFSTQSGNGEMPWGVRTPFGHNFQLSNQFFKLHMLSKCSGPSGFGCENSKCCAWFEMRQPANMWALMANARGYVSSYTKLVWTAQFQQQLAWANFPNAICMNISLIQRLKLRQNMKSFCFIQISALEHNALTFRRVKQRLRVFSAMIWDKSQFTKHSSLGTSHRLHNW